MMDEEFLSKFFWYFTPTERSNLARVCIRWKDILYRNQKYWIGLTLCVHYKQFRQATTFEKARLYASFIRRGFHTLVMMGANHEDENDLVNYFPLGSQHVHALVLKWCAISDRGLEHLVDHLQVKCVCFNIGNIILTLY
jgi:F-box/leucine-rich repeat protein 16